MEFNQHILSWYRDLKKVSSDDSADFEVMLLDKHHDSDAISATLGTLANLMQNGFNPDLFRLLTMAAHRNNLISVRSLALNGIIAVALLNDTQFRQFQNTIEDVQDVLVDLQAAALAVLIALNTNFKHLSSSFLDVRKTLIFRLIVVGEKANQAFDQSCC